MEYTRLPEDDRHGDEDHPPSEDQPLLRGDLVPEDFTPPKSFQRKVEGFSIFFLVLVVLGSSVQLPATTQVLEKIICETLHPDVLLKMGDKTGDICKSADVQGKLAKLLGWMAALECIPS